VTGRRDADGQNDIGLEPVEAVFNRVAPDVEGIRAAVAHCADTAS
jgi:hypothetical protein